MDLPRLVIVAVTAAVLTACGTDGRDATAPATATVTAMASPTAATLATTSTSTAGTVEASLEQQYLAHVGGLIADLGSAAREVAAVMERADVDSETWRRELSATLEALRTLHTRAQQLDPPSVLADLQSLLLDTTERFDRAATLLEQGVATLEVDRFLEASQALIDGVASITTLAAEVRARS